MKYLIILLVAERFVFVHVNYRTKSLGTSASERVSRNSLIDSWLEI